LNFEQTGLIYDSKEDVVASKKIGPDLKLSAFGQTFPDPVTNDLFFFGIFIPVIICLPQAFIQMINDFFFIGITFAVHILLSPLFPCRFFLNSSHFF